LDSSLSPLAGISEQRTGEYLVAAVNAKMEEEGNGDRNERGNEAEWEAEERKEREEREEREGKVWKASQDEMAKVSVWNGYTVFI
jgi:hypothetical protein